MAQVIVPVKQQPILRQSDKTVSFWAKARGLSPCISQEDESDHLNHILPVCSPDVPSNRGIKQAFKITDKANESQMLSILEKASKLKE